MLRPLEELLELFSKAGFDEHGALHAARLFTGFLYQHLLHELQERCDNPQETDDVLRLGLHRLPVTQFPRLRSLAALLAAYDGAAELMRDSTSSSPDFAANSLSPGGPSAEPR